MTPPHDDDESNDDVSDDETDRIAEDVEGAIDAGDPDAALELLERAARDRGGRLDEPLALLRADALAAAGRIDEACADLRALRRRAPAWAEPVVSLAEVLIDSGDPDAAIAALREGRAAIVAAEPETRRSAELVEAEAEEERDRPEAALAIHERALARDPDDAQHIAGRGRRLFRMARFDEAARDLERARKLEEGDAAAIYALACIRERDGDLRKADKLFAEAEEIDPDAFPRPVRISNKDLDRAIEEALASLPDEVRPHLENVTVVAEDVPDATMLRESGHDPLILGLYEGIDLASEQEVSTPTLPSRVIIYRRNVEKAANDREELIEEIRTTVLHEIGHHLGYDDDGLDEIGIG